MKPYSPRTSSIALFCLLLGGATLGLSTNVAKLASEASLPPFTFLLWSIFGATGLLLAMALLRRQVPPVNRVTVEYFLIAGLTGVAGPNLLFFIAVPHVGAGFVALMISLPPLLTYIGAVAYGVERFHVLRAMGVLTALAGAVVLAVGRISDNDFDKLWIVPVLGGVTLLAIGNLYRTLRWPPGLAVNELAPGMLVGAATLLTLASLHPKLPFFLEQVSTLALGLVALQSFIFALMFKLLFELQRTGGPVLLSLLGSVGAVVGVPVSVLVLGESVPKGLMLGGALIAAGIFSLSFFKNNKAGSD